MVAWLRAVARMASRTRLRLPWTSAGCRWPTGPTADGTSSRSCLATVSGSGRRNSAYASAASSWATIAKTKTPENGGSPSARPTVSPGSARLGPITAPTVVDHTTSDRSRPRVCGAARSVAANRDCSAAAVAAPAPASPDEQDQHRAEDHPEHAERDPGRRDQGGRGQRDAAAPPVGQPGQRDRQQRRTEGAHGRGHPGPGSPRPARWRPGRPRSGRPRCRDRRGSGRWRADRAYGDAARPDRRSARSRWSRVGSVGDGTDTRQPLRRRREKGSRHSSRSRSSPSRSRRLAGRADPGRCRRPGGRRRSTGARGRRSARRRLRHLQLILLRRAGSERGSIESES